MIVECLRKPSSLFSRKFLSLFLLYTVQPIQKGVIGITVNADYYYPLTDSAADIEAAERALVYKLGW